MEMAIVRQMSKLIIRGSLANVTMANLTEEEKNNVSDVMVKVSNHPEMAKHKNRFIRELSNTISADYSDDRQAAEEEFQIAIWRAAVSLLYHRKYSFECRSCLATTYRTKRGQPKPIDRQNPYCPNCGVVLVVHAGETDFKVGEFVQRDEFQNSYKDFTSEQDAPQCVSPIRALPGDKTYEHPQQILEDDVQLVKFFGEFVWNYFRQTLKENSRVEHCKIPQKIIGSADYIITQEILSLCSKMKLVHNYCAKTQPEDGYYNIAILGLQTPPEFSSELAVLIQKGRENNVIVECNTTCIRVRENRDAPNIEATIIKPEHVLVLDSYSTESDNDDDGKSFTISQVSYRTTGMERMQQEDHTEKVENEDVIDAIRDSLPDGECRQVFDIWACRGQTYLNFSEEFGDGRAHINHIASHLKITARAVNQHKDTIKVYCLAHGLTPE